MSTVKYVLNKEWCLHHELWWEFWGQCGAGCQRCTRYNSFRRLHSAVRQRHVLKDGSHLENIELELGGWEPEAYNRLPIQHELVTNSTPSIAMKSETQWKLQHRCLAEKGLFWMEEGCYLGLVGIGLPKQLPVRSPLARLSIEQRALRALPASHNKDL